MPFNELQRRDSWPPTILRIPAHDPAADLPSLIDENPISFFLTAPEDIDDFLSDEELSAGIESSAPKQQAIREISPSSLQRVPILEEEEEEDEFSAPMTLADFTARHGRQSRSGHYSEMARPEKHGLGLGITLPEHAAMRGRARVRLIPEGRGRGRGRARTLSARRPQSWREPSPEIWRIEEEREGEDEGAKGGVEMGRSVSTPGSVGGGILKGSPGVSASASASPGPKKRVRWADI